ncbi:cupredoxin domain-containing protein [Acidiferrimicrobium sp. IK]|uniref:plastocyanin/azurin family copper-binding protein n=1 Tax=Acidiferrimicrobium sp. IK TaxID=2871700 RepID=UPI0021CAF50D|nr:plastocyanin/azurin family copper-binding protein [Acidiferrimicrobium sp. IK]MCU4184226.1 cupredoxin domain-containing protein [Acidiferrimicrobium sp. IK]
MTAAPATSRPPRPRRRTSRCALAALGATAALAVTGCGGSSSGSPAATPNTATPSTATSGTAAGGTTAGGPTVTINNFAFSPKALTIAVGTTVTWVNRDVAAHDVKFSAGGIPVSPLLLANSSRDHWSHTFTKAGTYPYICGIHPYMTGTVTVGS